MLQCNNIYHFGSRRGREERGEGEGEGEKEEEGMREGKGRMRKRWRGRRRRGSLVAHTYFAPDGMYLQHVERIHYIKWCRKY